MPAARSEHLPRQVANQQITAEQLLREAASLQSDEVPGGMQSYDGEVDRRSSNGTRMVVGAEIIL